ncbi:MAG: hypothetical protein JSW15_10355 [Deltaproteobacteria bacterium]|jgi:hypothetical protein|nr:MAG: hypothetical protein JSW15_10355 [Deltaproteobacteria bacterium]
MAEHTELKEGIAITVGLDTDDKNRMWAEDFLLDPPPTKLWLTIKNIGDKVVEFRLPSRAKGCFVIVDNEKRRLWTHPDHAAHGANDFRLEPGEVYEKRMDAPWNRVFIKPEAEHILAGWLNGHPHLSTSVRFSLSIKNK